MLSLDETWVAVQDFLEMGGDVLVVILCATFFMWTLILERHLYLRFAHRSAVASAKKAWGGRRERTSWCAHQIRRLLISRVSVDLERSVPTIKTLVALCPLLGLLGTVTGMVQVFDVMAVAGSGNPRAMASGVSRATIPTMAGMVAALSGFVLSIQLDRRVKNEGTRLADELSPEE